MNERRFMSVALAAFAMSSACFVAASESKESTDAVPATAYQDAWGPPAGTTIPPLDAVDQHGTRRDLASLSGEKGFLVLVSRSAVW